MGQSRYSSPAPLAWWFANALRRLAVSAAVAAATLLACTAARAQGVPPPTCVISPADPSVINCTGDQSDGIALHDGSGPFRTLNVYNLVTGIAPPPGTSGIVFTSDGDMTINVNTSPFGIVTMDDDAIGILGESVNGSVVINSNAAIETNGTDAPGIRASGETDVVVVSTGKITTTGTDSDGIEAISSTGTATVIARGDISATGPGSAGIFVFGGAGARVETYGSVVGGTCCAGVMMQSSGTNTLINWGTIAEALADQAINLQATDNFVENYGTVTGDVALTDGFGDHGTFNNHAGALFNAGDLVQADLVTNAGTISPGGRGALRTTALGDDFVQYSGGVLAIDINPAGATSDEIGVSNSAQLAGNVAVSVLTLPALRSPQTFPILTAMGIGLTDNGLGVIASPALHATLDTSSGSTVVLSINVDFVVSGLNRNERDISASLDQGLAAGGGVTPVLLGLLNTPGLAAYENALAQLSPEIVSDAQIGALYAGLGFANSLLSCKVNGTTTASIIREGQCLWAGASAVFLDQGTTSQQIGFNQSTGLFAAGAQVALDNVWRLGLGAGYQSSALETARGATSEGELAQGGIALKYNPGPFLLAGVVNAGHSWNDTKRPVSFGGFSGVPQSSPGIDIVNGGVRAAYVFGSPQLYLKPTLDAAATRLDLGGFTETGGGAANLTVASASQTVYTIAPSVETGTEWWIANGTLIRPFLRGGAAWYEGGNLTLSAAFVGAPAGVAPFAIFTDMDDVMGTVGAGIDMITGEDSVLHVAYDGQLGETTQIHSVALKGGARF